MPGLNGIDAARRIRELRDNVVLMFVNNMPQYALQGYRYMNRSETVTTMKVYFNQVNDDVILGG